MAFVDLRFVFGVWCLLLIATVCFSMRDLLFAPYLMLFVVCWLMFVIVCFVVCCVLSVLFFRVLVVVS